MAKKKPKKPQKKQVSQETRKRFEEYKKLKEKLGTGSKQAFESLKIAEAIRGIKKYIVFKDPRYSELDNREITELKNLFLE